MFIYLSIYLRLISGVFLCQFLWKTILIIVLLQGLNNNRPWRPEKGKYDKCLKHRHGPEFM